MTKVNRRTIKSVYDNACEFEKEVLTLLHSLCKQEEYINYFRQLDHFVRHSRKFGKLSDLDASLYLLLSNYEKKTYRSSSWVKETILKELFVVTERRRFSTIRRTFTDKSGSL